MNVTEKELIKIIKDHKDMIYSIINKYSMFNVDKNDLMSAGINGLIEAVKRFNPNKESKLSTYAYLWIQRSIQEEIRKDNMIWYPALIKDKETGRLKINLKCDNHLSLEYLYVSPGESLVTMETLLEDDKHPEKIIIKSLNKEIFWNHLERILGKEDVKLLKDYYVYKNKENRKEKQKRIQTILNKLKLYKNSLKDFREAEY